jgi:hypothetical protein
MPQGDVNREINFEGPAREGPGRRVWIDPYPLRPKRLVDRGFALYFSKIWETGRWKSSWRCSTLMPAFS